MSRRFDLYGWRSLPLLEAAQRLEVALGITLRLHDSTYIGGDYYRGSCEGLEDLTLQPNYVDEEGYLSEPDFPAYQLLVYVTDASQHVTDRLRDLSDLTLIRTDVR